ncbi:MAG: reactive intermediate/imine deaminase [Bacteroidetes bacterium HGW-Bacteroidetes-13]|nr:MAG: reactive intermediate/imine deaminase [Bacteroidetes bacterium HGW-Bacteroidetes-13]
MKTIIKTHLAPAPIGPYNQAIRKDHMLYVSGQVAINPETNELVLASIEAETKQVMENLKNILHTAETNFDCVLKSTIFLKNMNDFAKVNEIYGSYFNEKTAPARETVQVSGLPKNVNVEISMIAYCN